MTNKKILDTLKKTSLAYEIIKIDPEFADTYKFCEKYNYPINKSANTIIVCSKKEPITFAAAIISASTKLDVNHRLKELMSVGRISFAKSEQTKEVTGMMIGGVTLFGLPKNLKIYADKKLLDLDYIILGGGGRSTKIKISPNVLNKIKQVQIIENLAI